ncbi:MAG: hypothetical protein OXD44_11945, partial [Gammaproteobacteria bacterium]|nr:hypothetical protein [Gammaproteobacteria bacterium]
RNKWFFQDGSPGNVIVNMQASSDLPKITGLDFDLSIELFSQENSVNAVESHQTASFMIIRYRLE